MMDYLIPFAALLILLYAARQQYRQAKVREALEYIVRGANGDPYGIAEEALAATPTPQPTDAAREG